MTTIDINEDEFAFLNQHITAVEFQFSKIDPRRMGHVQQMLSDNIACPGLKQALWLFGTDGEMFTIKATLEPFHCPDEALEELVMSIATTMDEVVPAYNKLSNTDIEHEGFKLYFLDPELTPDCD